MKECENGKLQKKDSGNGPSLRLEEIDKQVKGQVISEQ